VQQTQVREIAGSSCCLCCSNSQIDRAHKSGRLQRDFTLQLLHEEEEEEAAAAAEAEKEGHWGVDWTRLGQGSSC